MPGGHTCGHACQVKHATLRCQIEVAEAAVQEVHWTTPGGHTCGHACHVKHATLRCQIEVAEAAVQEVHWTTPAGHACYSDGGTDSRQVCKFFMCVPRNIWARGALVYAKSASLFLDVHATLIMPGVHTFLMLK
eukprot:1161165-Pelagomonas_calceolata.AAC.3